jgi:hypothetical protein
MWIDTESERYLSGTMKVGKIRSLFILPCLAHIYSCALGTFWRGRESMRTKV